MIPPRRPPPSDAFRPLELIRRQQPDATRTDALENLLRAQERLGQQGTMGVPSGLQPEPMWAQAARLGADVLPPVSVPELVEGVKKAARGDYAGGGKQIGTEALLALATGGAGRKVAKLLKTELGAAGVLGMEANRMAELSPAQFNRLRNSLPGNFEPLGENYERVRDARNRLLEEWHRRSNLRDQQRAADALDPTVFREQPMPYADRARSYGPGGGRRRGGWMADSVVTNAPEAVEGIRAWHGSSSGKDLTSFDRRFFGTGQGNKYGVGHYSSGAREIGAKFAEPTESGKQGLYEIAINSDPATLLDYDQRLRDQPGDVVERLNKVMQQPLDINKMPRQQLQSILQSVDRNGFWSDAASRREGMKPPTLEELREAATNMDLAEYLQKPFHPDDSGGAALRRLETLLGNKGASKALEQLGFSGLQYVDPNFYLLSQAATAPKNYVIFDPDRIKILQALGLAALTGTSARAASPRSSDSPRSAPPSL